jgi:hypothetical protein
MSSSMEPDPTAVEGIDPAQMREDADRSPEEKQNREQSPAPDTDDPDTGLNNVGEEVPIADTEPPA